MILDPVKTPEEILIAKQREQMLERHIDRLSPRVGLVLRKRLGLKCNLETAREIAKLLGVGRQRVYQIEDEAVRILARRIWIEEKPEDYRRERDKAAKEYEARLELERQAAAAEAAECKARQDAPAIEAQRAWDERPWKNNEQPRSPELALEREYKTWAAERAVWLNAPMPEWAEIKPYLYKMRKVPIKRDWLKVATEGFRDGA